MSLMWRAAGARRESFASLFSHPRRSNINEHRGSSQFTGNCTWKMIVLVQRVRRGTTVERGVLDVVGKRKELSREERHMSIYIRFVCPFFFPFAAAVSLFYSFGDLIAFLSAPTDLCTRRKTAINKRKKLDNTPCHSWSLAMLAIEDVSSLTSEDQQIERTRKQYRNDR